MLIFPLSGIIQHCMFVQWGGICAPPATAQRNASAQHVIAIQFSPARKARTNALKRATARVRKRAAVLYIVQHKNAAKRV